MQKWVLVSIGIATGGMGIAGTIPLAIIGGVVVGLMGKKIGAVLDRIS